MASRQLICEGRIICAHMCTVDSVVRTRDVSYGAATPGAMRKGFGFGVKGGESASDDRSTKHAHPAVLFAEENRIERSFPF